MKIRKITGFVFFYCACLIVFPFQNGFSNTQTINKINYLLAINSSEETLLFLIILVLALIFIISTIKFKRKKKSLIADIERKTEELNEKQLQLNDTISFAKRIQDSLIPQLDKNISYISDYFIIHKSKEAISGDFYWFSHSSEFLYIAIIDCVAHGVPGAFMSYFSNQILDSIINQGITQPSKVLDLFNEKITEVMLRTKISSLKDGINASFCKIHKEKNIVEFAGSVNPLFLCSDNIIQTIRADKFSVGSQYDKECNFTLQQISVKQDDIIYLFSDGFADQIGGPKRKKYTYSKIKDLLVSISNRPLKEQKNLLTKSFFEWKENLPQLDDITIIAIKL